MPKQITDGEGVLIVPHVYDSSSTLKQSEPCKAFMDLFGSMPPGFMSGGRGDIGQADYGWDDRSARS